MAFRAPGAQTRRPLTLSQRLDSHITATSTNLSSAEVPFTPDTEEEWVVFSPSSVAETATVSETNRLSRVSELGSTTSHHYPHHHHQVGVPGSFDELEEDEQDEDDASFDCAETDSLQAFRDHEAPVGMFPTHDGLGTFASSSLGPVTGYRSLEESLRIVASADQGSDTNARIQKWRMEQSQAFLKEVERATRRRTLSFTSRQSGSVVADAGAGAKEAEVEEEETASMSATKPITPTTTAAAAAVDETTPSESFWKRLTRSFIRDIIGIDDSLLEVLFGEALPAEACEESTRQHRRDIEARLLDRIAKELGELVHLYTSHASLSRVPSTLASPKSEKPQPASSSPSPPTTRHRADSLASKTTVSGVPQFSFAPTLSQNEHAALWGIEEGATAETVVEAQLRREYWEQELDMRLVFSYLKTRFYGPTPASPVSSTGTATAAPSTSMRFHHPLINRRNSYLRKGGSVASKASVSTKSKGYYWDVATSVGSGKTGSCVGTGVWAAI